MAKRKQRESTEEGQPVKGELSAKVQKVITAIRKPFMAYAQGFAKLAMSRAELAPKFMDAYKAFKKDGGVGGFVGFVRHVDPSVPVDREDYRDNKVYQAADYLRRLRNRADTGTNRAKPVRGNLSAMARLLATVVAITAEPEKLWAGVETEFGLTKRQVTRLKEVVAGAKPLIKIPNIKPLRVSVIHVEPETAETEVRAGQRRPAA